MRKEILYYGYSEDELRAKPLLFLHAILARMEREIEEALADYQEPTAMPGETYRDRWAQVRHPEDVRVIYPVDQDLRTVYIKFAEVCRRKEAEEIAALMAEAGRAA